MKKLLRLKSLILCIMMLLPMAIPTWGYGDRVEQNPDVNMPKASPVIDGIIEASGAWSSAAYMNDATLGRFWGGNLPTSTAELYFAYDANGLYLAADIIDNDSYNGLVVSTGYDNINNNGTKRPYGFNGDVMTLMLDPLGKFERSSYSTTPWYNIGIFADNTVKVYRSQANEGDITTLVNAKGSITEEGWKFEVYIPWDIIINDARTASNNTINVTKAELSAVGSRTRAAIMYMDRYYVSPGVADTWGRFITVCKTTYDGYSGNATSGVVAKAYGIILKGGNVPPPHDWPNWNITLAATCTEAGSRTRTCRTCGYTETEVIPATGHVNKTVYTTLAKCTENGSIIVKCDACSLELSSTVLAATGHTFGEWTTVTQPTATTHGLKRRVCSKCKITEEVILPATNAPTLEVDGYLLKIHNASEINHIRYASGIYTTSNEIRSASDCVNIDTKVITSGTANGVFTRNMPSGGIYSFWIRMNDGSTYILSADLSTMTQEVTSDGVTINVKNLYGVKDFLIATGDRNTYREVADNMVVHVTSNKIGTKQNYSYTVSDPGTYTVCVRYTDDSRPYSFFKVNLSVTEPTFEPNGLQLKVSNLSGLKVIRVAYGDYSKSGDIKRAEGCRNFTPSTTKGADPYTIQFRENGLVSVSVEYTNGYIKIYQFEAQKKVPTFDVFRNKVTIGNLDGLQIIRYAPGEYSTSSEIKNAPGSKYIKPAAIVDGTVELSDFTDGQTYSFSVQYTDESYNYYVATLSSKPIYNPSSVVTVSNQRQLLLEDLTIDYDYSDATVNYNPLIKREAVFTFNASHESRDAVYHNIVKAPDGTYRMYYKATASNGARRICYIQSTDGKTWTRPNINGTNIVLNSDVDNLYVYYDPNPACPPNQRWKGFYGLWGDSLIMMYSSDGNNFSLSNGIKVMGTPADTQGCFYDTLNTVYWDAAKGKYVAFVRGFHEGDNYNLSRDYVQNYAARVTRDIRYAESTDCINWSIPIPLVYDNGADYHMYANAITPYYRAPQLYIGLATRYRSVIGGGTPLTDIFLISSRDLVNWDRTETPYLTPDLTPDTAYLYTESGYPCEGTIETAPGELSYYMKEAGPSGMVLYRYTIRVDGYRNAYGSSAGNKLFTKYINFNGSSLELNYKTGATGKVRVTITDTNGNSITSDWLTGDQIAKTATFNGNVADFKNKPVFLTFELYDANLYSYKFN